MSIDKILKKSIFEDIEYKMLDLNGEKPVVKEVDVICKNNIKKFFKGIIEKMIIDEQKQRKFVRKTNIEPLLRGFTLSKYFRDDKENFYKNFLVVGDKGPYIRCEINEVDYSYYDNIKIKEQEALSEIVEKINRILIRLNKRKDNENHFNIINFEILHDVMERRQLSNEQVYTLFMSFLHNICGRWNEKKYSPFVSLTYGKTLLKLLIVLRKKVRLQMSLISLGRTQEKKIIENFL